MNALPGACMRQCNMAEPNDKFSTKNQSWGVGSMVNPLWNTNDGGNSPVPPVNICKDRRDDEKGETHIRLGLDSPTTVMTIWNPEGSGTGLKIFCTVKAESLHQNLSQRWQCSTFYQCFENLTFLILSARSGDLKLCISTHKSVPEVTQSLLGKILRIISLGNIGLKRVRKAYSGLVWESATTIIFENQRNRKHLAKRASI